MKATGFAGHHASEAIEHICRRFQQHMADKFTDVVERRPAARSGNRARPWVMNV
jgi:hypothetical protein